MKDFLTRHWTLFLGAAAWLLGFLQNRWRESQERAVLSWPSALGRIESGEVKKKDSRRSTWYVTELRYSYNVESDYYSGRYRRNFDEEEAADAFLKAMEGSSINVRYRTEKPGKSKLPEDEVNRALQIKPKPLSQHSAIPRLPVVPSWARIFLLPLIALSASGLVLSLWVHISALLGRRVLPWWCFGALHVGIFLVWFPACFWTGEKMPGKFGQGTSWEEAFVGAPAWIAPMVRGFFYYAMVNFAIFMFQMESGSSSGSTDAVSWRGFSGHWMLFYSAAMGMLLSVYKSSQGTTRCIGGHIALPGEACCRQCGQPVLPQAKWS